jgi:hypothetical protein
LSIASGRRSQQLFDDFSLQASGGFFVALALDAVFVIIIAIQQCDFDFLWHMYLSSVIVSHFML